MKAVNVDLPTHTRGDTWEGVDIGPVLFDDVQPSSALVSCRMYFRSYESKRFGYGFNSEVVEGQGTIIIDDANTWEMSIDDQDLDLEAGRWRWDFETTDAAGAIRTLYKGVLTIKQDETYDD